MHERSGFNWFERVTKIGLTLSDVELSTKYDGTPVLKMRGCFLAGVVRLPPAHGPTIVVRCAFEDRELMVAEAPDAYFVTDLHARYPVVLVRLRGVDDAALRELLTISWTLTAAKA